MPQESCGAVAGEHSDILPGAHGAAGREAFEIARVVEAAVSLDVNQCRVELTEACETRLTRSRDR